MPTIDSSSVARRLALISASAVVGVLLVAGAFLVSERRLMLDDRKAGVRQTVEAAHGVIVHFHAQVAKGALAEAEARQRAIAAVKSLRYSGNDYFWVNDMHPTMVMHPTRPELDGKDLSDNRDPDGKRLFVEMVQAVRAQGAGFVEYRWPKPGSDRPVPKVSYVQGFAPWGWVIGSGVYVDDVDAALLERAAYVGIGTVLLAGLVLAIGWRVGRGLLRQLGGEPTYANAITSQIASGRLDVAIALRPGDEGSVLKGLATMRESLAELVAKVREGSEFVAVASREIAQGNSDLSARTESQASALQQTAASMEQLGSTVRSNAENARQASEHARQADRVAAEGGEVVDRVVETMKGINDSAKKIADIIGVIDGIAFQTNILALNAAVEAARAGEQGRGFAVVAAEVRSLATRSASAAKEIKSLIGDSVTRVEQGSALVERAGATMTEMVGAIRRVTEVVHGISVASGEQSNGVAQIGEAISQMDQATQKNAAMVEEMAAAASGLKDQAQSLVDTVAAFTVPTTA